MVVGEHDSATLLIHSIARDTGYQRQGGMCPLLLLFFEKTLNFFIFFSYCNAEDTIITWNDADIGTDVALSFQESIGCNRVWRQICEVQDAANANTTASPNNNNTTNNTTNSQQGNRRESLSPGGSSAGGGSPNNNPYSEHSERYRTTMIDEFEGSPNGNGNSPYDEMGPLGHGALHAAPIDLPSPTLNNLQEISKKLTEASLFQREELAVKMMSSDFIPRLLAAFKTAEDLEDEASLLAVHSVVRAAIMLNDTSLLETLLNDDYAMDVIGALEYDPEVPLEERPRHREYLTTGDGALKEIIPITDATLRSKIVQAHRMGYVKDAVLPRALDDSTFATLSSLQLFNQVDVVAALQADPDFFPALLTALREADAESAQWRDLVGFLQELVGLSGRLPAAARNALLTRLIDLGLFPVLSSVLTSGDVPARLRAADVLLADVTHDPAPLRRYLQGDGSGLFSALVGSVLDPGAAGLQEQASEILKVLLDPDTMDSSVEKDRFIDAFYDDHVGKLLAAVVGAGDGTTTTTTTTATTSSSSSVCINDPSTLVLIIDLWCYCVTQHSYRIKYYILRNNVVEKVLKLMRRRERTVAAAALRFLRTCLAMKDEFYNRYLIKNALLEPVLTAFLANGRRYNLLNSAVLELLEFVRRENMKGLVSAIVESPQWGRLETECDYVDTFQLLKQRHEANQDGRGAVGGGGGGGSSFDHQHSSYQPQSHHHQHQQESSMAAAAARAVAAAETRRRRGEREEDADEENYFREDDDDEEEEEEGEDTLPPAPLQQPPSSTAAAQPPATVTTTTTPTATATTNRIREGQVVVVLDSFSRIPDVRAGRLVDYGDDEEEDDDGGEDDTLPLGALSRPGVLQQQHHHHHHEVHHRHPHTSSSDSLKRMEREEADPAIDTGDDVAAPPPEKKAKGNDDSDAS